MGRGIAQIAAQAGSTVKLFDTQAGAVGKAQEALGAQWDKLHEKGRLDATLLAAHKARLVPADTLAALADCDMVVEAIVERLDVKQKLFAELEQVVGPDAVLATNTSSLSVTAIAAALKRPQRFAGYHFFNPVPLMKVVEVIAGLKTDAAVCEGLAAYARLMGHTPVMAADTPGFIVNHAGRGYGTEALRIVGEGVADFATIDRILKDQVGFKLGPFELMDLTALDVSHPVMESIYQQYYDEPRYRPSVITAQRLAGGVAKELELPAAERDSLVHAAMTMNIAMTELQDQMAELTGKPNAVQQAAVRNHATQGCLLLARLGVADELWLDVVTAHHEDVARPGELHLMEPAKRLAHILRMIDRYAAMISPRKSRSGRTVTESLRIVVTGPKGERDEVGHALVRAVGLCPPGTFVRLDNRETGVVLRRSEKPNHPLVAILQDSRGESYSQPRLHRTAISTPRIQAALSHAQAPIQLNHHTMVQLGLYAARQTRLAAVP